MANTKTADVPATLRQIQALAELGCEIVRVAVPDRHAAEALPEIVAHSPLPVVADIHFDHRLALAALRAGVHGLRLNPGNIREAEKVREVVREAKARRTPIRVGVNAGSLPPLRFAAGGRAAAGNVAADGRRGAVGDRHSRGYGLRPDQGVAEGVRRADDGRGLPGAGDARAVPLASRRDRGGNAAKRRPCAARSGSASCFRKA